jgi:TonB family protein
MKPAWVLFFLGFPGISTVSAQSSQNDLKRAGLAGQVYAVSSRTKFDDQKHGKSGDTIHHSTQYYDKDGNLTLELSYINNVVVTRKTFSRPATGELVEKAESMNPANGQPETQPAISVHITRHTFKYDSGGRLEKEDTYHEDGSEDEIEYAYDSRGRIARETRRLGKDPKISTMIMTYDSGPLETGIAQYHPYPDLISTQTFTYEFDSHGNWTKKTAASTAPGIPEMEVLVERIISYYSPETGHGEPIPGETQGDALQPMPILPKIVRKSGGVLTASATKRVEPRYPGKAKDAHITGLVLVEITIGEDGNVLTAEAISGPPELRDAAVTAAKQWKFLPTNLSGVAVKVIGTITFNFMM